MADYRIEENTNWKEWHGVLDTVYAGNPQYVYPLRSDIESILGEKNAAFHGDNLQRWVVKNGSRLVGRIAAFVDTERNKQLELAAGGIGFFESIADAAVARLLLGTAEDWLRARGMQAVDGPINFGERDKFWGLLVRGWYRPIYQETYNPPYYQDFFEKNDYQPHEQCLTMRGVVSEFPGERLGKLAARVRERYGLYTEQIQPDNLRKGADDFAEAYNAAFNHWPYFKPLTGDDIYPTFQQMKPIMDPHLTCIAYNREGRPIGLAGLIPDINCFLQGTKGRLNWVGLPKFLYRLKFQKHPRNCKGIAFGIAQDYQRQGVYPLMVDAMFQSGDRHTSRTYRYVDMATIRGHNKLMVDTCRQMNTEIHRVHLAYRKALTPDARWEPFEMMDVSGVEMGKYGSLPR
ncbi:hypothetical protein GGR26_002918 [Lewinella marina]|uniref:N-acetyltransferase domain-containing protein n=1 Tax=Neolewinella marina TaxID=438751 RepID=A0A2G0CBJ5_9BACT|nr:hypothetical protein [Neolewinella marina]NJB87141.1 hypothetical protein [Neolewinella marina]PHK97332.1 hypothetical protein CGL56_16125 [Neolewinella marina]